MDLKWWRDIGCVHGQSRSGHRRLWRAGTIAALLLSLAGGTAGANGQKYEPFQELPPEIAEFLAQQGFTDLEFVVLAMPGKIVSFAVGGPANAVDIEEQGLQAGEYVVPGRYGFDFAKQPDGFHAVVVSTASPGSGNDCRRGGRCREVRDAD